MKRLKLCFVTDTWFPVYGGGPQVVYHFAKTLITKYHYRVDIITRDFSQQDDTAFKEYSRIKGLKIINLGLATSWENPLGRLSFIISSFCYLLFNKYDLIHAFPFISGLPAFLAGKINRTPIFFSVFALSSQIKQTKKGFLLKLRILLEDFLTFTIPYTILVTDNKDFIKTYSKRNIYYIPDGVDIRLFDQIKAQRKRGKQILFVGRFHKQKGIYNLLKAVNILKNIYPKFKLVIVGYGSEEDRIRLFIKSHNLKRIVEIKKPLYDKELVVEYKKATLLVLPSFYEGQGIVVFEAWASKIPVVATNVGSLKDVVVNGKNGYLVRVNKPKELAFAIRKVFNNPNSKNMGLRGYRLVKNNYTWENTVKELNLKYLNFIN